MAYFDIGASMDTLRKVSPEALYYNGRTSFGTGRTEAGVSFSQIMRQSKRGSKDVGSSKRSFSPDDIFEEAADRYQVDVNLLRAIAKAESGYNPSAVSQAGAMGVMQLMPETASSLGVSDPFDARQNIMGGASYISGLLKQYHGDTALALAAYNAGSGNVDRYGGIPPFPETQAYVEKVMRYAGQEKPVSRVNGEQYHQAFASVDGTQTRSAEYWAHMVDLMRVQMDMKLAGILSSGEEESGSGGIII